jgi:hypothetical protein
MADTSFACRDDLIRILVRDYRNPIRALDLVECIDDGLLEISLEGFLNEVGHHFGVGLGDELVAQLLEPRAERCCVFDDPIVHDRDVPVAICVGVRVTLIGCPMSCPTRMCNSDISVEWLARNDRFELGDLTRGFPCFQPMPVHDSNAGRVVPSILEALQALDEERRGALRADIAYDSTHMITVLVGERTTP